MMTTLEQSTTASGRLLAALEPFDRVLIVMHDNPDPDAIASGWAIRCLVERKLKRPVRLIGGGAIVRAENRHMVELLQPPLELVDDPEVPENTATVLVDCSLGASNQMLTRGSIVPVAVIDHHQQDPNGTHPRFCDIRTDAAASASIAADYLRQQDIEPGAKLATALLYAVRSETTGCEFTFSDLDRSVLPWLTERSDPGLVAEIENAPLSRAWFGDLVLATQNTFLYDDVAFCLLPRANGAEIVGEVADLLVRCEGVRRVFCGAVIGEDLLISVRTAPDAENASRLLKTTLAGIGGGGGHGHRAGGKVARVARNSDKITSELHDDLRHRWLDACKVDRQRGTRLVARHEIVEHL